MSSEKNKNQKVTQQNQPTDTDFYTSKIQGKEKYVLFGALTIACFIIFQDFVCLKKVYLFKDIGSDTINMFHPILIHISEYLKNQGNPSWTFSQGMGQNIFPLWLGDFFSNFIMLFDKDTIPKVIVFMEILKIFLAAFAFFYYLKEIKLSSFSCLIGALLYGFSGYMILGGTWIIFSTEAVYVAIMLLGFERWLNKGKWFLFVLGITLLGFLQPFYLFSYTIFLAGYIIVRYNEVHGFEFKKFIYFLLKTVGLAALGVAITAYQLLPDVLMLLESPRVGGEAGLSAKLKAQPVFAMADEVLRFTTTFRAFGSDMIGTGNNFKGWQNYLEAPLFYCGILCLVAFPQVFFGLNKKQKISYGILMGFFILPILFPYFRYAFWAFSGDYFRTFSLVVVLLLIFFTTKAISFIEQQGSIHKITLIITALFLLYLLEGVNPNFKAAIVDGKRNYAVLLVLLYSAFLYLLGSKTSMRGMAKPLILFCCFIEILFSSYTTINKRDAMRKNELTDKVGYSDYTLDAVSYLKQHDNTFFRMQKDYFSGLAMHSSINDAKAQGYFGTSSYHSFNQKNYIKFLGDLNIIDAKDENATRWAKGLNDRPLVFSLVSGKYWLSKRADNYLSGYGYDSLTKIGDVKIYRNRYSLPFGFAYNKVLDLATFKKLSTLQKDLFLFKGCVIDSIDVSSFKSFEKFSVTDTTVQFSFNEYQKYVDALKKDTVAITQFKESDIKGKIKLSQQKIIFFSIPFDEGWKAKINGIETKLYRVNIGLTGLIANKGDNIIELSFEPRLRSKGALISVVSILILFGLLFLNWYKKRKKLS